MSLFFLKGSRSADLPHPPAESHPLPECPGTPNCIIQSIPFSCSVSSLFETARESIRRLKPLQTSHDSQSLQIKAVFRIPVFGFKDDVGIAVESDGSGSILHIRSASRVGRSDLGVNRRRMKRILAEIHQNL